MARVDVTHSRVTPGHFQARSAGLAGAYRCEGAWPLVYTAVSRVGAE